MIHGTDRFICIVMVEPSSPNNMYHVVYVFDKDGKVNNYSTVEPHMQIFGEHIL